MKISRHDRQRLARQSLRGLTVGDALGDQFFLPTDQALELIGRRQLPPSPWPITDDSIQAHVLVEMLLHRQTIDQNILAKQWAQAFHNDPGRGYGATAQTIFRAIQAGTHWKTASLDVFSGMGSKGNGAAMRSGPLGAYFFDDVEKILFQSQQQAEITHAHLDAQHGAQAIALAASYVARLHLSLRADVEFLPFIINHLPTGLIQNKLHQTLEIPPEYDIRTAVSAIGNGSKILAEDTVPLALWCVNKHPANFEKALWTTLSALGDRDTLGAIVGSVVALHPNARIPTNWLAACEPLPDLSTPPA